MSEELLSEEVRDLILRHIDTVAQLEALLFLRERPAEEWDAIAVAKRLYAPPAEMGAALAGLASAGFLRRQNQLYHYAPTSNDGATVDALAKAYARQLITITNLIHSKPRGIRAFSDAFKFRKD
ncbi:hypothetical protein [uncultured Bradyrhizobium sp.]|jgi:hypothetical protein|uniref:hypothetical protein n=1 Tax=uncultured Bradyrhizobium sp. TaxID=199684 RepID=UPI00260AA8A3|nr:hypothetical protein [uncultured Bradyrhizobium sp.]